MKKAKSFKHFYRTPPRSKNFLINGIGALETMQPGIVNRPSGTGDSLLMFFHERAVANTKNGITDIPAGSMIYWEKCNHYYGNTDIPWTHSWIHFDGSEAYKILRIAGLRPSQIIKPSAQLVVELLAEIDNEITANSPDIVIIRNLFEIFIREIIRSGFKDKNKIQIPKRMITIRQYIEDNYHKSLSLNKMARRFSISPPHLSSEFKRWFGTSPGRYLIEYRLHEAEILLKDNNLQIADIAQRVGWDDVYHFSKIFKKHCGAPPSSMRSRNLKT